MLNGFASVPTHTPSSKITNVRFDTQCTTSLLVYLSLLKPCEHKYLIVFTKIIVFWHLNYKIISFTSFSLIFVKH